MSIGLIHSFISRGSHAWEATRRSADYESDKGIWLLMKLTVSSFWMGSSSVVDLMYSTGDFQDAGSSCFRTPTYQKSNIINNSLHTTPVLLKIDSVIVRAALPPLRASQRVQCSSRQSKAAQPSTVWSKGRARRPRGRDSHQYLRTFSDSPT